MLSITLTSYPDALSVRDRDLPLREVSAHELRYETRLLPLTNARGDSLWAVEVSCRLGPFNVHLPALSREDVPLDVVIDIMMSADNGGTDALLRALAPDKVDDAWKRNRSEPHGIFPASYKRLPA